MIVRPLPEIPPATAARAGLLLPVVAILGRGFGANVVLGRDILYNALFGLLALGAIGAARTVILGPSRWMGLVGLALAAAAIFLPTTALEIPALRRLGS